MRERLKELREDRDLKQSDIASFLNIHQSTYSNYESGRLDIPTQTLIRLAEYFHTSTDYILGITNVMEPYPHI